MIAENCKSGVGSESGRKLVDAREPKMGTRTARLLVRILTVSFDISDFLNSFEKWEYLVKQHDAIVYEMESVQVLDQVFPELFVSCSCVANFHQKVILHDTLAFTACPCCSFHALSAKNSFGGDSSGSG